MDWPILWKKVKPKKISEDLRRQVVDLHKLIVHIRGQNKESDSSHVDFFFFYELQLSLLLLTVSQLVCDQHRHFWVKIRRYFRVQITATSMWFLGQHHLPDSKYKFRKSCHVRSLQISCFLIFMLPMCMLHRCYNRQFLIILCIRNIQVTIDKFIELLPSLIIIP